MRVVSAITIWLLLQPVLAAPVQVEGIRIWAAPDSTRVVFDTTGPVQHELHLLSDPFRAVIDLRAADLRVGVGANPVAHDKFLHRIRSGRQGDVLRMVLDLKKFSRTKSFQLPPNEQYGHRLVVDLY